jgi:RNA 3'-terminal phosphate cyclase (ATP)
MIEIDGSFGEGGGQILRTSIALASVLGTDVRVSHIRAGRSQPGIMAQHLAGINAAASLSGAFVEGARVGSTDLTYRPGSVKSGSFQFDIGTAGSITLVLQTILPIITGSSGSTEILLTGGTDVKWSPPVDYLQLVMLPMLKLMGFEGVLTVSRRGHYPKGGGETRFESTPTGYLQPLTLTRPGKPVRVQGTSHAWGLPSYVAKRQAEAASGLVTMGGLPKPELRIDISGAGPQGSPGCGIVLAATMEDGSILGADALGERGKPAEKVGEEAGSALVKEAQSGACLDRHMGDMVVPYMVMAGRTSEVTVARITQHTLTNVRVAELLAGVKFQVQGDLGSPGILRAKGLGLGPA